MALQLVVGCMEVTEGTMIGLEVGLEVRFDVALEAEL